MEFTKELQFTVVNLIELWEFQIASDGVPSILSGKPATKQVQIVGTILL